MTEGAPEGWRLRLDPAVRRTEGGRVLVGGTPLRVLRLSDRGRRWLDRAVSGADIPDDEGSQRLARRLVDGGLAHPVPPPGAGPTAADVAVVVPVRDDVDDLAAALARVGPVAEVVVVDDGSSDPGAVTAAAAASTATSAAGGPAIRVLRHERSLGPGAARTTGVQATASPVVAFVDADVEVDEGWLDGLLGHLADPTVAAVAPRVRSRPGTAPPSLARYEASRSPLDLGDQPSGVRPGTRVPYVPTAALVVRRSAFDDVGGFTPGLRVGEDVDLVWRLHAAGWRVRYEPTVGATHPARPSLSAWLRQRVGYGTSAAALASAHGAAVAPARGLSGWSALAWAAVVAGHPAAGVLVASATTAALVPKLAGLDHPAAEAVRIAGPGHLWAGRAVAEALRRPWWPLAVALGVGARRTRPALAAAALVPPLLDWRATRPALDPARYLVLRLVDDVAYGTGVWIGCLRARSLQALLPSFSGPLDRPSTADR